MSGKTSACPPTRPDAEGDRPRSGHTRDPTARSGVRLCANETRQTQSGQVNHSHELLFKRCLRAIDSSRAPVIHRTRERLLRNDLRTRSPVVLTSGLSPFRHCRSLSALRPSSSRADATPTVVEQSRLAGPALLIARVSRRRRARASPRSRIGGRVARGDRPADGLTAESTLAGATDRSVANQRSLQRVDT